MHGLALRLSPLLGLAIGLQVPAPKKIDPPPPTAAGAVQSVAEDSAGIDPFVRPYVRYLWVGSVTTEDAKVGSAILDANSRSPINRRPVPLESPAGILLRVDLRHYASTDQDLRELISTWEELRFDPAFNRLLTPDLLKYLDIPADQLPRTVKTVRKKRTVNKDWPGGPWKGTYYPPGKYQEEEEYDEQIEVPFAASKDAVLRLLDPTAEPVLLAQLRIAHQSEAVIVSLPYYVYRSTSSVKGKGAYKDIYGGLYYEFGGVKTAKELKLDKATDEDVLFQFLGLGRIANGFSARQLFDELRSDQRVAMFRSDVTGKWRRVDIFTTPNNRNGVGIVSVSHDPADDDVDVTQHPIFNLEQSTDRAREVIYTKANGQPGYALFNGDGKRQDEAPFDVVADRTVPSPHTARLQNGASCFRCHWSDGNSGWKPLRNDVKTLLKGRLDAFGDLNFKDQNDAINRIAGWYTGSPEKLFRRGREDLEQIVLKATGPWPDSPDQTDVVRLTGNRYSQIYNGYWYDQVDARKALRELGINPPADAKQAVAEFARLVPPDARARVNGIILEDPRIAALREGLLINRSDWDLARSFAAERMAALKKP